MHGLPILDDLLIVLAVSIGIVYLFHLLRLPTIVGFLAAGAVIGPGGLSLLAEREPIEVVAEVGVILLLFTIGLELSLRELWRLKAAVLLGGAGQLLVTAAAAGLAVGAWGVAPASAVLAGALVGLSSTAIVLKLLSERGEVQALHGRALLAILIFQDLAVVPLMLLVPLLGGEGGPGGVAAILAKAAAVLVGVVAMSVLVVPRVLAVVVATRSRELFTLATLLLALGTAWITGAAGLPLALGAFLAGVVISESEYTHQVLAEVGPMRDALSGLFFVSIGLLVEPRAALERPLLVGGLVVGVVVLKALVAGGVTLLLGYGARVAVLVGLGLAQLGEFSLILAEVGREGGLLPKEAYQLFLLVTVATMLLTPFLLPLAHRLAPAVVSLSPAFLRQSRLPEGAPGEEPRRDHVVLVGYGVNGRNVARVLRGLAVDHLVVELNPETVRREREAGVPIVYGDAARRDVLEHLGVGRARAVVVAIADPAASRQIVVAARSLNPQARIVVRARLVDEVDALYALGADEVVPEEFETSLELAARVMATYGATPHAVLRQKEAIRQERYDLLRRHGDPRRTAVMPLARLLGEADVEELDVPPGSWAVGLTLAEVRLRERTGVTVVAVGRGEQLAASPGGDFVLAARDRLMLVGRGEQIRQAARYLILPPGEWDTEPDGIGGRPG